jgi:hypothetical protein
MPNFDGGHYYLTALIPIAIDMVVEKDGQRVSPIQVIRRELATLPTALQTLPSIKTGLNSPFSRNTRTHFARFVVIEDVMYNGRDPADAILNSANPVFPQAQDSLECPFLLFVAEFDADKENPLNTTSYFELLWRTMEPELRAVFGHCVGFDQVESGAEFAKYIQRGQIETTMSFHDYWTVAPPLKSWLKTLKTMFFSSLLIFAAAGALGTAYFSSEGAGAYWLHVLLHAAYVLVGGVVGAVIGGVLGLMLVYQFVMKVGMTPFPSSPNTDLPSVLKALYVQRWFTEFAIDAQSANDAVPDQTWAPLATGEFLQA